MKRLFILIGFLITSFVNAQYFQEITYGVYVGGNQSKMDNIEPALIPRGIYSGYSTKEVPNIGFTAGFYINWKKNYDSKMSIEADISYSQQYPEFTYENIKDLEYNIKFNYNYLNAGILFKFYPIENLYIGAGPTLALNLNPNDMTYTSNGASRPGGIDFEPDETVQKVLKESFEGKNFLKATFGLGYEFNSDITIGIRYSLGLSDALETKENGFRYSEVKNKMSSFGISIGYRFHFDETNNFQ
ncbi:outer membrane beta-barrel protein [Flavobacterium sp.]|uniref:outer membrane beta-barrel protein n=1 Tax=Flavobacterium sp. TaxID=239 RepID=UPI003C3FB81E